jgi:cyclopropane fatty-acyl-phospholipid synthase-like methyltransferase
MHSTRRHRKTRFELAAVLGTLVLLMVVPGFAQEHHQSSRESILRLDSPERAERMQVSRVVGALRLTPGQKIADIGAGSGLFSRPIAQAVGVNGTVFAVDIDQEALKFIAEKSRENNLPQIKTVLAAESDPRIPEPVDLIVIIDTLHHVPDRPAYIAGLRRYLKPDGRVAIVDFTERWPAAFENTKYSVLDLDGWMAKVGMTRQEQHRFIENHFFAIYR